METKSNYYKITFLDNLIMDGFGFSGLGLLFLGIWIDAFRWKLIFSALFCIGIAFLHYAVVKQREEDAKERFHEKEYDKAVSRLMKGGYKNGN